jgi:DnaJ-class molecular chaperone
MDDAEDDKVHCEHCGGRGTFAGRPCRECGGQGFRFKIHREKPRHRLDRIPRRKQGKKPQER